jgi:hypothetical protein
MEQLLFPDAYDNEDAHSQVKHLMMQRKHLTIRVENEEVLVSSQRLTGLRYLVNADSWKWILNYLQTGDYEDFGVFPSEVAHIVKDCYQEDKVKELIEGGYNIVPIPFHRETEAYITLRAFFKHGKLIFRIRRTDEFTDYLINKDLW